MLQPEDLKRIAAACEDRRLEAERYWALVSHEPANTNRKALRAIDLMANGAHALRTWCLDRLAGRQPVVPPSCHPADVLPTTVELDNVGRVEPFDPECVGSDSIRVSTTDTAT